MRALIAGGALVALAACGAPPEPPPTAPPLSGPTDASVPASQPPAIVVPLPTTQAPLPTTAGVPGYPTYPNNPAYPVPTLPAVPTATRTTTPAPATTTPATGRPAPGVGAAPRCTAGPTVAQVVAAVADTPGIPDEPLTVVQGPFCAGTWQFSMLEIGSAATRDEYEMLSVVTRGPAATLQLVEAGTDVCSKLVRDEAPPGIRVHACGA